MVIDSFIKLIDLWGLTLIYKNVLTVAHCILFTNLPLYSSLYCISTNMSVVEVRFTAL